MPAIMMGGGWKRIGGWAALAAWLAFAGAASAADITLATDGDPVESANEISYNPIYAAILKGTDAYVPISAGNPIASGNTVTADGISTSHSVFGGASTSGGVSENNTVRLTNASAAGGEIAGGVSTSGTARNNKVIVESGSEAGTFGDVFNLSGGVSQSGGATQNAVQIRGTVYGDVYGGFVADTANGRADDNKVEVDGGILESAVIGGSVYVSTALSHSGVSVKNNGVVIDGNADVDKFAAGGLMHTGKGTVSNNSVTVRGNASIGDVVYGGVAGSVFGGLSGTGAEAANVENNRATIEGGAMSESVFGGAALGGTSGGHARANYVGMSGGNVYGDLVGGYSRFGGATGNVVNFEGGVLAGDIVGGWTGNAAAKTTGNVVNLKAAPGFTFANIVGGRGGDGDRTGNTLNTVGAGFTGISVAGFQNYNFTLSADAFAGGATVYFLDSPVDLRGSGIALNVTGDRELAPGDSVTLFNLADADGSTGFSAGIQKGLALTYAVEVPALLSGGAYTATIASSGEAHPFTKGPGQNQLTGLVIGKLTASLITERGIPAALDALGGVDGYGAYPSGRGRAAIRSDAAYAAPASRSHRESCPPAFGFMPAGRPAVFAVADGGWSSFRTGGGSHINMSHGELLVGLGWRCDLGVGGLLLGGFAEGGIGVYSSKAGGVRLADGNNLHNIGGGLLARLDLQNGLYAETHMSLGRAIVKFSNGNVFGHSVSFTRKSTYFGTGLGLGWRAALGAGRLDASVRYDYGSSSGDDLWILGDYFHLGAAKSHRLRLGGKYYFLNDRSLTPFAGASFEYEFAGKSNGSALGRGFQEVRLRGATVQAQGGVAFHAGRFSAELAGHGYLGRRRGVAGSLNLGVAF